MLLTNLVDVLAFELGDELLEALLIGVNTDGREDGLDIVARGGVVASKDEEEESCEVLHFEICFCAKKLLLESVPRYETQSWTNYS